MLKRFKLSLECMSLGDLYQSSGEKTANSLAIYCRSVILSINANMVQACNVEDDWSVPDGK